MQLRLINKTSSISFDEGYITFNITKLLNKKIITNVKVPPNLNYFRLSTTKIISENHLPLQVDNIVLDDI